MPIFSVDNCGDLGLNTDKPPHELPPNVFTGMANARCRPGTIECIFNYSEQSPFSAVAGAFSVGYYEHNGIRYWVSGNASTIYVHNGAANITLSTNRTATGLVGYQFTNFQGLLVSNNWTDRPQYWDGLVFENSPSASGDLPNWPSPNTRVKVMRSFKNFLIGLYVRTDGAYDAFDPNKKDSHITLSGSNKIATNSQASFNTVVFKTGKSTGKWRVELTPTAIAGIVAVGIVGRSGSFGAGFNISLGQSGGGNEHYSAGYYSNGQTFYNLDTNGNDVALATYDTPDKIDVLVDLDNLILTFRKNGTVIKTYTLPSGQTWYPAISSLGAGQATTINPGGIAFTNAADGYFGWTVFDSGTFGQRVLWSHPAEPGTYPESWDVTDDTKDAGWFDLADTAGEIYDCLSLGDVNVIYKSDSVWGMSFVATNQVFRFFPISKSFGALGIGCMAPFPGGHVVVTNGDVVVHDGSGKFNSIVSNQVRKAIFARLNQSNAPYAFVSQQPLFDEVWICLPKTVVETSGNYVCDLAYCWNWITGAITTRILPNVMAGALGYPLQVPTSDLWDSDAVTWPGDNATWDSPYINANTHNLMMVGEGNSGLQLMDTFSPNVVIPNFFIERYALAIDGKKTNQTYQPHADFKVDTTIRKVMTDFWPRLMVEGNPTSVTFQVGGQEFINAPIKWNDPITFQRDPSLLAIAEEDTSAYPTFANNLRFTTHINTPIPAFRLSVTFTLGVYAKVGMQSYDMVLQPAGRSW